MSPETLRDVALHIARSLITHGFGVIVLLSTHGGNQAVLEEVARQLTDEQHPGSPRVCASGRCRSCPWRTFGAVADISDDGRASGLGRCRVCRSGPSRTKPAPRLPGAVKIISNGLCLPSSRRCETRHDRPGAAGVALVGFRVESKYHPARARRLFVDRWLLRQPGRWRATVSANPRKRPLRDPSSDAIQMSSRHRRGGDVAFKRPHPTLGKCGRASWRMYAIMSCERLLLRLWLAGQI